MGTGMPHQRTFKKIKENLALKPTDKILEIGAGRGVMLKKMESFCQKATGIDINPWSVALKEYPGVELGSGTYLNFPENSFDKIYSANTIEHILRVNKFFKEVSRVLKPKGRIVPVYPWEIFRGMTALKDAIFIFKNPFRARDLHVHNFSPDSIKKRISHTELYHLKSCVIREKIPQYLTVLEKRGMV